MRLMRMLLMATQASAEWRGMAEGKFGLSLREGRM